MTDGVLEPPRRLTRDDDRSAFDSGAPELDDWFRRFAFENQQANNAVTYGTVRDGAVPGYYAIPMSAYTPVTPPERMPETRPVRTPATLPPLRAPHATAAAPGRRPPGSHRPTPSARFIRPTLIVPKLADTRPISVTYYVTLFSGHQCGLRTESDSAGYNGATSHAHFGQCSFT